MAKPYDALTRALIEAHPDDWIALLGIGVDPNVSVRVVDSDVSTVTGEADKVLSIEAPVPWLVHVEFQSSYDPSLPRRLFRYNALLSYRHRQPVLSVAVLLWPESDGPTLDGLLRQQIPVDFVYLEFRYRVLRIWEWSVDELTARLGTMPLAVLAVQSADDLPMVISRMREALDCDPPVEDEGELWTSIYILIGRQFHRELADRLLTGVRGMKESSTYQAIFEEGRGEGREEGLVRGRVVEGREILLRLGRIRFGEPDATVRGRIAALDNLDDLENLTERLLSVGSWDELLAGSTSQQV